MRNTKIVLIEEGRDKGKRFVLTEMPAMQIEKWGWRATMALLHSGVDIPEEMRGAGMASIVQVGFATLLKCLSRAPWGEVEPLLDELLTCVEYMPDPAKPTIVRPLGVGGSDDIEDARTLLRLRSEVFELHTGFSIADAISRSTSATTPLPTSSGTGTSRRPSARRSRAA